MKIVALILVQLHFRILFNSSYYRLIVKSLFLPWHDLIISFPWHDLIISTGLTYTINIAMAYQIQITQLCWWEILWLLVCLATSIFGGDIVNHGIGRDAIQKFHGKVIIYNHLLFVKMLLFCVLQTIFNKINQKIF